MRARTQGQGGVSPSDARPPVPPCGAAAISLFIWTNIIMGGLRLALGLPVPRRGSVRSPGEPPAR